MAKQVLINEQIIEESNPEKVNDVNMKKYLAKISMPKPYEVVDYWSCKPDSEMVLEVMMSRLLNAKGNRFFKIEVSEIELSK